MTNRELTPPTFQNQLEVKAPEIDFLLKDERSLIQTGILFTSNKTLTVSDPNSLNKNTKSFDFVFQDKVAFLNPKEIWIEVTIKCVSRTNDNLVLTNYVTSPTIPSHSLIADFSVTIGETCLSRPGTNYPTEARIHYLTEHTRAAKKSFLKLFEGNIILPQTIYSSFFFNLPFRYILHYFIFIGYDEDKKEPLVEDIKSCFEKTAPIVAEGLFDKPKNGQARRSLSTK